MHIYMLYHPREGYNAFIITKPVGEVIIKCVISRTEVV